MIRTPETFVRPSARLAATAHAALSLCVTALADTGRVAVQTQGLESADPTTVSGYGRSVAVDGDRMVVGSPSEHRAYVYERAGRAWVQSAPLDADLEDRGQVALLERAGGAWPLTCTFLAPGSSMSDNLGWSVDLVGSTVVAGAPNADKAYVFDAAAGCALEQVLVDASASPTDGAFGWSVAIDGERLAVGARDFVQGGSVRLYAWDGAAWCEEAWLNPDDAAPDTRFGATLGLDGGTVVVGAQWGDGALNGSGTACAFEQGAEQGTSYCVAGLNSTGQGAHIDALGSTVADANDFHLFALGAPPHENGLSLFGPNAAQIPFGNGFRCVSSPVYRQLPILTTDAAGTAYHRVDMSADPALARIAEQVPITMNFQLWYRDAGSSNLTDGVRVDFR